ncbi:MAG: hypothetical protein KGJ77_11610, partial [Acidobacteriota bacterium]|nr:hypothetical protein [Acidobacteriota bacterium]
AALHLPVPMPYRQALAFLAQHKTPAFLFGDRYLGGRAYFYPALVAVKTPLASLVLWVAGLVVLLANRRRRKLAAFLLFPLLFFLSIAVAGHFNIGVRHILPLYFFMPVVAGAVVLVKRRWALAATVALIALAGVSTWSQYPSYLAYVNEAFGGPNNAYKLVSDSNLDWGQDLYHAESYLKEWFPHRQVALAYFGTVPVEPSVDFFSPSHAAWRRFGAATPHVIAISCSWEVYNPTLWHQVVRWAGPEPVAQVGHSILIFQRP